MIDKKWKWVAKDEDGSIWAYVERPFVGKDLHWHLDHCGDEDVESFSILKIDTADWKDSLHEIIHHEDGKIEFRKARPELKVDDPVFVRDSDRNEWLPRHFAQWEDTGDIEVWPYGHTSFTAQEDEELPVPYLQYKLP